MDPSSISREQGSDAQQPDTSADSAMSPVDDGSPGCGVTFKDPAMSSLQDDFTKGLGSTWTPIGDNCTSMQDGELLAEPTANSTNVYCQLWTTSFYHLTCDSFVVKVVESTADILGAQTFVYVKTPTGSIEILKEQGNFFISLPGDAGGSSMGRYDPARDVWWRFRESGGEFSFATSQDGTEWNTRLEVPTPMNLDRVQIALGAGVYKPLPAPGRARYRCFNLPGCT